MNLTGSATNSTTCSTSETFSFTVSGSVNGGQTYTYNLTQTDSAMNTSTTTTLSWIQDVITADTQSTPTITSLSSNPYYSNSSSITLSGVCTTGDTVVLAGDVVTTDVITPSNTLSLSCTNGTYSFTIAKSGSSASYNFGISQYKVVTSGQNTDYFYSSKNIIRWNRDIDLPPTPGLVSPPWSPMRSSGTLPVKGDCEEGATVVITKNGVIQNSTPCSGLNYSMVISEPVDGTFDYAVYQGLISIHVRLKFEFFSTIKSTDDS